MFKHEFRSYKVNVTIGTHRDRLYVSARNKKEARYLVLCQAAYIIYRIRRVKN